MVDLPGGDDMLAERMSLRGDVPDDVGIERLVPMGWCERRGAGEPELEYDPSKLGIHAVLQQITNLLSNHIRTQWLPAQRAKLKEELAARLAEVEALGKGPNEVGFDEVFAELESCISNEYLYPGNYESAINLPGFAKYNPAEPIPTSLYARMRWRVAEKARVARFVGDAFDFLTKQFCRALARKALDSSILPLVLGRFSGLVKLLQDTIDHQWSRHREAAEKAANEGIAVKIDTFSQSGGAAQSSPSASEIGSSFILTAHGLVDISPEATFQSTDWVVRTVVDAFVEHCLVNSVMAAQNAARTPLMTLMRRRPLEEDEERRGQRATLVSRIEVLRFALREVEELEDGGGAGMP
eukprot:scaffold1348_cov279-Pinguiococcus_pyrenoidosus.AAC.4